jgi:hypothetical protein
MAFIPTYYYKELKKDHEVILLYKKNFLILITYIYIHKNSLRMSHGE